MNGRRVANTTPSPPESSSVSLNNGKTEKSRGGRPVRREKMVLTISLFRSVKYFRSLIVLIFIYRILKELMVPNEFYITYVNLPLRVLIS